MERIEEDRPDLIDLGAASMKTQGTGGPDIELVGMWHQFGISDED